MCLSAKHPIYHSDGVAYDTSARDSKDSDPNWSGSTVTIQDGFVYLIDEEEISVQEITAGYCWFRARNMQYRVIPD